MKGKANIDTAAKRDWRGIVIGCLIICFLGIALRYPLLGEGGHKSDLAFFAGWSNAIHDYGVVNVYDKSKASANYPVGFMYILSAFERCARWSDPSIKQWTADNFERPFKIFLCAADIMITLCLVFGGYLLGASSRNSLLAGACRIILPKNQTSV